MKQYTRPKPERVYVKVTTDFDETGYMCPSTITWEDGRTFKIEKIRDFRPAQSASNSMRGDCYTVVICGQEKHLFFERTDAMFASTVGRWFVEKLVTPTT